MAHKKRRIEKILDKYFTAEPLASVRKPGVVRCLICNRKFVSIDVRTNRVCSGSTCQKALKERDSTRRVWS